MTTPTLPDNSITSTNTVTEINAAFTAYSGTSATVVATGMDTTQLDAIATAVNNAKISAEGISGVMALTSGQDSTELTRLFSKDEAGENDTVVTTGMNTAALDVIAANTSFLSATGISGTMALTSGQNSTELTALFEKYSETGSTTAGATVVATGMASAALDVIAANTTKIKDASITGIMALTSDQNATELTALFGKDDAVANATVVATGMDSDALNIVATNATKITAAKITGVMALTSGQVATQLTALFSKDDAIADATVNAASMDSAALNVLATNIAKIATNSISGAMALTSGQGATQLTALFSKDAESGTSADDTVVATGMVSSQLDVLAVTANAAKIASISGVMALTSGQDATELTTLFNKEASGADDTVVATGMLSPALNVLAANTDEIASAGITGTLALTSGQSSTQLSALLGKAGDTTATVTVNAAGMDATSITALIDNNTKVDSITGAMALTNAHAAGLSTLFGKDDAVANDTVVATGMNSATLDIVAANTAKITAAGITGVMALTSGQDATELTALFGKDNSVADATVVATGMDSAALNAVAANVAKINTASITGVMALTSGQGATQLTALFGKDDATADATVVATGMVSAALDVVAANAAKVASISGVIALTSGQDATELTALFNKESSGADDTVIATGMLSPALDVLAANVDEIATDGITGIVGITSGQNATELDALLGKTSTAATVTVNATGMGTDAIDKLVTNTTKVDTITGGMTLTSGQDSTELANLFSKDDAVANDTVVATGMATAALDVVAANVAKITAAGITGVMALTSGQDSTELTNLFSKDDTVANATVDATSMNSAALNVVATNAAKIANASITGAMALTSSQGATQLTALFGKDDATANDTVVATGMISAQLDAVAANTTHIADLGITGVMALTSGQDSTELTNLFAKDDGTADATVVATGMSSAAIDVIALNTDKLGGAITGVMTLTSLQDATDLAALFAADDTVANATVDATGMVSDSIDVLAANVDKIAAASIKGAMTLANAQATVLTTLFAKDDAVANDIVNATSMDATALGIVATNIAKVASITGAMGLSGQSSTALTTLFSKDDTTANDTVDVTSMNSAALDVVAANATKIATASITGTMALASGQDSTELTALFGKYGVTGGTDAGATVVATGMNSAALDAVAAGQAKIMDASITGTMALTSGQDSTELTALFGKYGETGSTTAGATVVATGMNSAALDAVAANVTAIKSASITGVMALTSGQDATDLTALFGKDDSVADATITAVGVAADALNVISTNIGKVASITGAIAFSGQNSTQLTNLFSKDDTATDDTVVATGMDTTALDVVATNAAKVASITGVMALTSGQDSTELTTLFGKDAESGTVANNTVVATGMDSGALDVVAANANKIAPSSITGVMALTSGQNATELTALFGKDDGVTNATVVATGMDANALDVVAANADKITAASITGVMALTSGQDSTELTALFGKDDTGATDTVVATGMNTDALDAVAANAGKIAAASITGVMALTSGQVATELTALFGKDDTVANATVVATGMDTDALDAVAANVGKIAAASITGVMALTSGQNASELTALFSKDDTMANATVVADGVGSDALNVIVTNIGKVANAGITGEMTLTSNQNATALTSLFGKDDATANDVVVADGMGAAALDVIAANASKIAISSITGVMALTSTQDSTELTALFGKDDGVADATVRATGMNSAALNVLATNAGASIAAASITGTMALTSGQNSTALHELFAKDDTAANDTVVATGMNSAALDEVAANAEKIAAASITGVMALTSGQDATELTALFGKDDAVTNATVVATGMDTDALDAVAANIGKVSSVSGVMALTSGQNATELTALFSKDDTASNDTVVADGMDSAALNVLALNTAKIAAAQITGVMTLTSDHNSTALTALFAKDDATTNDIVVADGMNSAALNVLVTNAAKIDVINGAMALTSGQTAAQLTTLFGKDDTAANDTVVATGMSSATLDVVATNADAHVASITGVMTLTSLQNSTDLTALFAKDDTVANATVAATGMDSAALDVVAQNADKIEAGRITGVMVLTSDQDSTELTALFGKDDAVANANVTATGMNPVALDVVAANATKIAAAKITGVMALTGGTDGQNASELTALFSKDDATADATVVATGMDSAAINVLATNIGKIAADGISGAMAVGSGQSVSQLTTLFTKYDTAATDVIVNATGMNSTALDVIATNDARISAHGINGEMTLSSGQDSTELTALLGKYTDSTAPEEVVVVHATGMDAVAVLVLADANNIAKIDSITGALALDSGLDDVQLTALFDKYDGTSATVDVTGMSATQFDVVISHIAEVGSVTGTFGGTQAPTLTSGEDVAELTALLSKSADGAATAIATGMDSPQLDVLAANAGKIVTDGIIGTMVLTGGTDGQDATELTALLGKYDTAGTAVEAVATGMDSAALDVLATAGTVIATDKITGLMSLDNGQDATELTYLFSKYDTAATDVIANATGMDSDALDALAGNAGVIHAHGISGVMALTSGQDSTELTALFGKDDTIADATVVADGMDAAALNVLATNINNIAVSGITGVMALTGSTVTGQDASALTALFSKYEGSAATVASADLADFDTAAVNVFAANIDKISGITGAIALTGGTGGQDAMALTALFSKDDTTGDNTVVATGMNSEAVSVLATNATQIASISGDLALDNGQNATALTALFTAYAAGTGATATVVATDMDTAALHVLADTANIAMIQANGITGVMALDNTLSTDQLSTELTALFGKEATGSADDTVIATSMDTAALDALAANVDKIATGGITGVMALTSGQDSTELTDLFSVYSGAEATVTLTDASGADFAPIALNVLAGNIDKIASITGAVAFSGQDALQLEALFSKDDTTADNIVDATDMGSAELAVLVTNIDKIAATDGIIGALALTAAQDATALTALFGAYDAGTTATVDVTGMDESQVDVIVTNVAKIASASVTGTIVLTKAHAIALKPLFEADDKAISDVSATGLDSTALDALVADIDAVASITDTLALTSDLSTVSLATLFDKYVGNTATVDASGMDAASLQIVAQYADGIAAGGVTGTLALTSGLGSDELTALFDKYTDTAATVVATGLDVDAVAVVAANTGDIATDGITGTLNVVTLNDNAIDLDALLGKVTATGTAADVTVNATGMSVAELDAVATNIAKVDTLVMNRAHSINISSADTETADALTVDVTGGVLTVTGTTGADTVDLSSLTGHRTGSHIIGGLDDDAITLVDSVADVVELASTGTDTVTGFNVTVANGAKDKIAFADAPSLPGVGSVSLTTMAHVITAGITKVNNNAAGTTASDIYDVLTNNGTSKDLTFAHDNDVVYLAIDNGANTAIARLDAHGNNDLVIDSAEITVIGILSGVTNAGSVSFAAFTPAV